MGFIDQSEAFIMGLKDKHRAAMFFTPIAKGRMKVDKGVTAAVAIEIYADIFEARGCGRSAADCIFCERVDQLCVCRVDHGLATVLWRFVGGGR